MRSKGAGGSIAAAAQQHSPCAVSLRPPGVLPPWQRWAFGRAEVFQHSPSADGGWPLGMRHGARTYEGHGVIQGGRALGGGVLGGALGGGEGWLGGGSRWGDGVDS